MINFPLLPNKNKTQYFLTLTISGINLLKILNNTTKIIFQILLHFENLLINFAFVKINNTKKFLYYFVYKSKCKLKK